jgi:hypothetical protein
VFYTPEVVCASAWICERRVTPTHGDPARGHGVEKEWD